MLIISFGHGSTHQMSWNVYGVGGDGVCVEGGKRGADNVPKRNEPKVKVKKRWDTKVVVTYLISTKIWCG